MWKPFCILKNFVLIIFLSISFCFVNLCVILQILTLFILSCTVFINECFCHSRNFKFNRKNQNERNMHIFNDTIVTYVIYSFVARMETLLNQICFVELLGCTFNLCMLGYYVITVR